MAKKKWINDSITNPYESITGDWNGVLNASGTELLIVFHITRTDNNLVSTMDSPDQNTSGIPIDTTSFKDGTLSIASGTLNMEFTAQLNITGDTLFGQFNQGCRSFELVMTKETIERREIIRPQNPKEFPYHQEEVEFLNPTGGHSLAGTLTIPVDGVFEKVVILISGSGPQDRNEEVMDHRPFFTDCTSRQVFDIYYVSLFRSSFRL